MTQLPNKRITVQIDSELAEIIPDFFIFRQRDLEMIRLCLVSRDLGKLKQIGHNLKGTGGGFGFEAISTLGARIEQAAEQENLEEVGICANELSDYLIRVDVEYV